MNDVQPRTPKMHWTGDLNDDCSAEWNGLLLRAEAMSRTDWWWAVIDTATREQVASSHDEGLRVTTGKKARREAEAAARKWVEGQRLEK